MILSTLLGQQHLMGALLDDGTLMENGDLVAEFAGGEAVADVDGGLVAGDVVELRVDLGFCDGVQCGGGLIQDNERCILVQCPGNGDLLRLAAGDGDAVLARSL